MPFLSAGPVRSRPMISSAPRISARVAGEDRRDRIGPGHPSGRHDRRSTAGNLGKRSRSAWKAGVSAPGESADRPPFIANSTWRGQIPRGWLTPFGAPRNAAGGNRQDPRGTSRACWRKPGSDEIEVEPARTEQPSAPRALFPGGRRRQKRRADRRGHSLHGLPRRQPGGRAGRAAGRDRGGTSISSSTTGGGGRRWTSGS